MWFVTSGIDFQKKLCAASVGQCNTRIDYINHEVSKGDRPPKKIKRPGVSSFNHSSEWFEWYSFVLSCLISESIKTVGPYLRTLLNSTFMWCCLFCDTVWFVTLWIKPSCVIIFWKATEQYFHVMLWFLHFWCLDQNMQCEQSLESLLLNSISHMMLFALIWCSNSSFTCCCFFLPCHYLPNGISYLNRYLVYFAIL